MMQHILWFLSGQLIFVVYLVLFFGVNNGWE